MLKGLGSCAKMVVCFRAAHFGHVVFDNAHVHSITAAGSRTVLVVVLVQVAHLLVRRKGVVQPAGYDHGHVIGRHRFAFARRVAADQDNGLDIRFRAGGGAAQAVAVAEVNGIL